MDSIESLRSQVRGEMAWIASVTRDGKVMQPPRSAYHERLFHTQNLSMAYQVEANGADNPHLRKINPEMFTAVADEIARHERAMRHIELYERQSTAPDFVMPDPHFEPETVRD